MKGKAFEPLRVGQVELRNRIVRTAHGVKLPWSDDGGGQIGYHLARARGGVAMAIIGIGGVHASNPTVIPTHDDSVVPGLRSIANAVHEEGMKLVQQIWHGGAVKPNSLGGAPWSASAVPNPGSGVIPIAMTQAMIDEMVTAFANSARRVRDAGLDGVEIHAANGYLINQFLSRASNHRTDNYGGSLENRMRFANEILDAVRAEVGDDFMVGIRLTTNEFVEEGLEPPEVRDIAVALEDKVQYINLSLGSYWRPHMMNAPMDEPSGYMLESSAVVSRAVTVPTIVTGRIMTMDLANHVVESGIGDMVSMVRGLIADPEIVNKSREDRTEQIRPCIGVLSCVSMTLAGSFACAVNPSAGHEDERPSLESRAHRVEVPRRVLVVGGGPAGMEAARSAALRGHDVTLIEMRRELGGQTNIAARAPFRSDFAAITRWQADELARLGVKVVLNTAADPDVVMDLSPDALILATGSTPREDGIQIHRPATPLPGADLRHVHNSWDLFGAGRRLALGQTALVFDDIGEYEPMTVADALGAQGIAVTYVTPYDSMAEKIAGRDNTIAPIMRRITGYGVQLMTRSHLREITPEYVVVRRGDVDHQVPADNVFLVGINSPNRELADFLDGFTGDVHTVGDAAGFRTLTRAIHDGDAAGRMV